jgi:hypothetical protein
MKTILEQTGTMQKSLVDEDDKLIAVSRQDVSPVIESVKRRREEAMSKDFKPVAEIPDIIVEQMMRDGSWNDPAAIRRWLNDPQNECFRIWKGRV